MSEHPDLSDKKEVVIDEEGRTRLRFDPRTVGRDTVFLKKDEDIEILER